MTYASLYAIFLHFSTKPLIHSAIKLRSVYDGSKQTFQKQGTEHQGKKSIIYPRTPRTPLNYAGWRCQLLIALRTWKPLLDWWFVQPVCINNDGNCAILSGTIWLESICVNDVDTICVISGDTNCADEIGTISSAGFGSNFSVIRYPFTPLTLYRLFAAEVGDSTEEQGKNGITDGRKDSKNTENS